MFVAKPIKQPLEHSGSLSGDSAQFSDSSFCQNIKLPYFVREEENSPHAEALLSLGANLTLSRLKGELCLKEVLGILHQQGFYLVLLECGSQLASSFF